MASYYCHSSAPNTKRELKLRAHREDRRNAKALVGEQLQDAMELAYQAELDRQEEEKRMAAQKAQEALAAARTPADLQVEEYDQAAKAFYLMTMAGAYSYRGDSIGCAFDHIKSALHGRGETVADIQSVTITHEDGTTTTTPLQEALYDLATHPLRGEADYDYKYANNGSKHIEVVLHTERHVHGSVVSFQYDSEAYAEIVSLPRHPQTN
jgi:hypothetical protein